MDESSPDTGLDQAALLRFLGYRLTRTELQIHKRLGRGLAAHELKNSEYAILTLIGGNPGAYLRQLGEALDISPSNLVPVVERLVQRELVRRVPDPRDRRLQQLHLTDKGQSLQARAQVAVEQFEQWLEEALSAAEKKHLFAALDKLAARVSRPEA
ncbi:MAG: MarR family transcriptional regulator [Comamonas sp.]